MTNKIENQTIYEIFRACRLCGAGGGYKMPIIQSVVTFDCNDVELRQKIQECVKIEVKADDKMPPLICELCVDKVNDFYEFLEMCRQTNKRTRLRLGLPPQTMPQGAPGADDCILGVTEPVFIKTEPTEPASAKTTKPKVLIGPKSKKEQLKKKEEKAKEMGCRMMKELQDLKQSDILSDSVRSSRSREARPAQLESRSSSTSSRSSWSRRAPTPPRDTRPPRDADAALARLRNQQQQKNEKATPTAPKSILKKETKQSETDSDSDTILSVRAKRTRDKEPPKTEVPAKKVKITLKLPPRPSPGPKSRKASPPPGPKSRKASPPPGPKSRKASPPPGPKSRRASTPPGPKSRRASSPPGPKSRRASPPPVSPPRARKASPPPKPKLSKPPAKPLLPSNTCSVCEQQFKSVQAMLSHQRTHTITYTNPELACNSCGEWFPTAEETAAHHKRHKTKNKPYRCRRCGADFKQLSGYDEHSNKKQCKTANEAPDRQCPKCCKTFTTKNMLDKHECTPSSANQSVNCKCGRTFATFKSLRKHEILCAVNKKATETCAVKIDRKLRSKLRPVQVRIARCDALLDKIKRKRYNVSAVSSEFGLDKKCFYPYKSCVRVKSEPLDFDGMVSIKEEIKDEFYTEEDYVHWDSDLSSDSDDDTSVLNPAEKTKKVDSLTTLSLKTIFSRRCLGKVPRKLRKVKTEKLFDSLFNDCDNMQNDINNIISNLDDAIAGGDSVSEVNESAGYESDSQDRSILNKGIETIMGDNTASTTDITESKVTNSGSTETEFNAVNNDIADGNTDASMEDDNESREAKGAECNTDKNLSSDQNRRSELTNVDAKQNGHGSNNFDLEKTLLNDFDVGDTDKINGNEKIDDVEESRKLMDELDAQIGESETRNEVSDVKNISNNISLDDLVQKDDFSQKSLGLDRISDNEFSADI